MSRSRRTSRYVRVGFAVLLVLSTAQAAWWILDQWWFTAEVEESLRALYEGQRRAAERLLATGVEEGQVREMFPDLRIAPGAVEISPAAEARMAEARRSRLNQYLWEGGFFMVVLLASLGVIGQALRHDAELRRRQRNFLASVSHELKSPLASARMAADTLEMRDLGPEAHRTQVGRILRNIDRLEAMITNLLDTVRIEQGSLVLKAEDHDLRQTLEPVLGGSAERAGDLGIALEVQIPEGIIVRTDRQALRVVARNLLENALEAVTGTEQPKVHVTALIEARIVTFEVRDNGCGFEPEQTERLFEKFYRPGDEIRRGGRGAGLGLHIVRELVTRSGGEVEASSEGPGRGAVFRAGWPLAARVGGGA